MTTYTTHPKKSLTPERIAWLEEKKASGIAAMRVRRATERTYRKPPDFSMSRSNKMVPPPGDQR